MSRMLRGQATLQSIIGKSSITKRPGNVQKSLKTSAKAKAEASTSSAPVLTEPPPIEEEDSPDKKRASPGLPEDAAKCPVCGQTLRGGNAHINLHLDKCLAKKAGEGRSQSKLSKFAARRETQPPKRTKLAESSSCPDLSKASEEGVTTPEASPKRKGAQKLDAELGPLRTRSGKMLSPARPTAEAVSSGGGLQSPFQPSSQEPPLEDATSGRLTEADEDQPFVVGDAIVYPSPQQLMEQELSPPNTGRGGPAASSGAPTSRHADGIRFQILAIGRRFNSSGVIEAGQVAELRHEADNPRDRNALLFVSEHPAAVLGYVPRTVAHYLTPLVKAGRLQSHAVVSKLGGALNDPISIDLEVWPAIEAVEERAHVIERQLKAKAAAENSVNLQRSGSGTGEMLRSNFLLMLAAVMELDSHLISQDESLVFQAFKEMPDAAQMLFLRLFLRAGPWFKLAGMAYTECPDLLTAATQIEAAGLGMSLKNANCEERKEAVKCLTSLEVQSILATLKLLPKNKGGKTSRRADYTQILLHALDSPTQGDEVFTAMASMAGPCIRLSERAYEAIYRAQRIFFLNEGQSLSNFLVLDLGILQYPEYGITRTRPVFRSREVLLDYEKALRHAAALDAALESDDSGSLSAAEDALKPAFEAIDAGHHKLEGDPKEDFLLRFSAAWVHTSMATLGVSILEKQKRHSDACDLLRKLLGGKCCPARRGEWWSRLTINLSTHLKRDQEALETAEAALADEWVKHGARLDLQRRAIRLSQPPRRWKVYPWAAAAKREPKEVRIVAQPLPNTLGIKSKFLHPSGDGECSVEQLALTWYSDEENGRWCGVHAEGGIWATLFGLLMWEVLFAPVPDVFRNQFQTAPLDLPTPAFFPARTAAIERCLQKIREGRAPEMLRERWDCSYKTMCAGVNWERNDIEELCQIALCIGGDGLAAVCSLLAEDRSGWQGGMPDLLLWNPQKCIAKLSEVKGPRDNLSMQQRAWLKALSAAGIDVEVFKVIEPETAKKRGRGRSRR